MTAFRVESCGPMTSLQDSGRIGSQRFGVSRSGAMDLLALAEANATVGNPPAEGALEFMLLGATLTVEDGPVRIALSGAPVALAIDGVAAPLATAIAVAPGGRITVGPGPAGIFAYLAATGGFDVAADLGSVSLQARARIGGLRGRALRAGDRIPIRAGGDLSGPAVTLTQATIDPAAPVRVVLGPQDDHFDEAGIAAFLAHRYTVSTEADRMGYRLAGPAIRHRAGFNIVSDGIVAGSVQVPGSGVPIVMMADHQTTGGYPKIATVISADLRVLAHRRTGDAVQFRAVTVEEAQAAARERAALIASLGDGLRPVRGASLDPEALLAANLAGDATDALRPLA